jgi:hypothetical protein
MVTPVLKLMSGEQAQEVSSFSLGFVENILMTQKEQPNPVFNADHLTLILENLQVNLFPY